MYGKFGCGVTHEQAVEEFNGGKTVVQIARKYGITTASGAITHTVSVAFLVV